MSSQLPSNYYKRNLATLATYVDTFYNILNLSKTTKKLFAEHKDCYSAFCFSKFNPF